MSPLLEVKNLSKNYTHKAHFLPGKQVSALSDISFTLARGEILAIMGETSSGKSTLAKIVAGVETPSSGDIWVNGQRLEKHNYRQRCQVIRMVFQDSDASLNRQLTIGEQLDEPLRFNTDLVATERRRRIREVLQRVGLLAEHAEFFPHMLATGQKQRVAIARAILLEPQIVVADEALAALDPSVRAQIINLLLDLQQDMGISYIFVSHSAEIVKHIADKILVLQHGKIVEFKETAALFDAPTDDYIERLLVTSGHIKQQVDKYAKEQ
ncbi:peptide ABC transporter ATP-binding protein [Idiomarina tyrosinivorans]|uniref:Peptide ABC transporter ATP-binding protein n=1 Tax=Idiomarina tyrosinivorans TaxID=1445662 RepID=A0A432ZRX5_9GAMM|nr:ATP-binding cassette domain-containing protein [Idiomarina tyrosinivorans]RUO80623.1 peptide ABC transporter ATP-binding protein [Idiomarina tyrosinivorans]